VKIGIDARPLSVGYGGIARSLENILGEMLRIDQVNEYYLYSHRDFKHSFDAPNWRKRIGSSYLPLPGSLWLQTEGRRMVLEDSLDVFWGAVHALPRRLPLSVGKLLTIYDLTWRLHPETMTRYNYLANRLVTERSLRSADIVIAISQSTGRDLETVLAVPASKIHVVHLGVSPRYKPSDPSAAAQLIARKYHVSENYICAVGTVEPRKNLATLVEAVGILQQRGQLSHQLLIAGASGWKNSRTYTSVKQHRLGPQHVNFLGYVPEEDLPTLYAGAAAFVFPSLYEGFGLPLVEAMACGTPVIASSVSSIPEVVGDAGLLASPLEPEEFAGALARLSQDQELRQLLVEKGLRRARDFRWEASAARILDLFREARNH
jgi:glycosyltransferase involved in cell wall biosynthesis